MAVINTSDNKTEQTNGDRFINKQTFLWLNNIVNYINHFPSLRISILERIVYSSYEEQTIPGRSFSFSWISTPTNNL